MKSFIKFYNENKQNFDNGIIPSELFPEIIYLFKEAANEEKEDFIGALQLLFVTLLRYTYYPEIYQSNQEEIDKAFILLEPEINSSISLYPYINKAYNMDEIIESAFNDAKSYLKEINPDNSVKKDLLNILNCIECIGEGYSLNYKITLYCAKYASSNYAIDLFKSERKEMEI